jgi:hypothetical protein
LEEVKRSAGYSLNLNNFEIAISDDRLEPGWYRIISAAGTEMPTEAPGTFRCKTWYPIWLDGIDNYYSKKNKTKEIVMLGKLNLIK